MAMAWYLTSRMIDTTCVGLGVGAGRPAGTVTPQESVENVQGLLGRGSVVTEIESGVEVVAGIDARKTSITVNDKALVRMFPLVITVMGPVRCSTRIVGCCHTLTICHSNSVR